MKTIIFTLITAGIFSTSLFKTVDLVLKNHEVISEKKSHFLQNIDGKSRATKPKKKP